MDNSIVSFPELVEFIRSQIREYELNITENILIEDDLGVTGDAAYDLIIAFGNRFKVGIDNFNFRKYFHGEPGLFFRSRKLEPITVGHLAKAIKYGKPDDEITC